MNVIETAIDADALSDLRDLAGDDPAFLDELFSMYIDQADKTLAGLRKALERSDRVAFSTAAHCLASSSLNIGALFVASACQAIERAMSDESARPAASQLRAVEHELKAVISEISMLKVA